MTCKHEWTVENVRAGLMITAVVACLKCLTLKKPLGTDGPMEFVTQGTESEAERLKSSEGGKK